MKTMHKAQGANILSVEVETNCPMGGDTGHGGFTTFELKDVTATDIRVTLLREGVKIELGGDSECETFIECLRFAADELEKQLKANSAVNNLT